MTEYRKLKRLVIGMGAVLGGGIVFFVSLLATRLFF